MKLIKYFFKRKKYTLFNNDKLQFFYDFKVSSCGLFVLKTHGIFIGILLGFNILFLYVLYSANKDFTEYKYKTENEIQQLSDDRKTANELHKIDSLLLIECKNNNNVSLDKAVLKNYIESIDCWYPDIVYKQAIIESGCGNSDIYKRTNNLYGMKKPVKRTACDINRSNKAEIYAQYDNWRFSVLDRILWELSIFNNHKPSKDLYISTLNRIYSETEDYTRLLELVN